MENIKISNFRKIKDTWDLDLAPITFFTGKNNSGKSSALKALMVLSDYCNSSNLFELDFLGGNSSNHNIENYSNCINWSNNTKSNISFEFERHGHLFTMNFSPNLVANQDCFQRGVLESLLILNKKNDSKIEFKRQGGESYQLHFDNQFLNRKNYSKESNENKNLIDAKKEIEKEIESIKLEAKSKIGIAKSLPIASPALLSILTLSVPIVGPVLAATAGLTSGFALNKLDSKTKFSLKLKLEKLESDLKLINKKLENENAKTNKEEEAKEVIFGPLFEISDLSLNNLSLNNIFKRVLIPYLKDYKKDFGKIDVKDETIKLNEFSDELMDIFRFEVDYLSPHRCNQERLILNEGTSADISKLAKEQVQNKIKKGSRADLFIKKWMDKFDIGIDYEIISVHGQASVINIYEEGNKKPINIADKGFGAGQIFTILLKIAQKIDQQKNYVKKNFYFPRFSDFSQVIIIEEPEANLHPALQSTLADLFFKTYKEFGIRFILETHSEYMIRKSQLLSLKSNWFKLYYFDVDGPYEMEYTEKGGFLRGFGKDFFDLNDNLALDLVLKSNS